MCSSDLLGGLGSVGGAISGAFVLMLLQNLLTRLPVVRDFKNLYVVVLGVILILTITFFPRGLAGGWRELRVRWSTRERKPAPDHVAVNESPSLSKGVSENS